MTSAVFSTAPADTAVATLDFKVNYLRPVFPDGDEMTARARILHRGTDPRRRRGRAHQRRGQAGRARHRLLDVPAGPPGEPGRRRARLGLLRSRGRSGGLTIERPAIPYSEHSGTFGMEVSGTVGPWGFSASYGARTSGRCPQPGTPEFDAAVARHGDPRLAERLDGRARLDRARFRHRRSTCAAPASGEEIQEVAARARDRPGPEGSDDRRLAGTRPAGEALLKALFRAGPELGRDRRRDPLAQEGTADGLGRLTTRPAPGAAGRSSASARAGAASRVA